MTLTNRIAIITGGNRGFGFAIAKAFREAGATVVVGSRSNCDVTEPHRMDQFVADVLSQYGRIDILVNNAAVLGPVGRIEDCPYSSWSHTITTNLLGPAYLTGAVLPIMKAQGRGKIINIVGGGASEPLPRRSAYACSKAALVRLTETVAAEVSDCGIDVNAVAPGPMATDQLDEIILAGPEHLGEEEHAKHLDWRNSGATPMAIPARLCVYLASDASNGVTGRTIAARWDKFPFDEAMKERMRNSPLYTLRRVQEANIA